MAAIGKNHESGPIAFMPLSHIESLRQRKPYSRMRNSAFAVDRSHRVGPCSEQRREARTMVESRWAARLGKWALWLALTGLALAAVGVVLARYDVEIGRAHV